MRTKKKHSLCSLYKGTKTNKQLGSKSYLCQSFAEIIEKLPQQKGAPTALPDLPLGHPRMGLLLVRTHILPQEWSRHFISGYQVENENR